MQSNKERTKEFAIRTMSDKYDISMNDLIYYQIVMTGRIKSVDLKEHRCEYEDGSSFLGVSKAEAYYKDLSSLECNSMIQRIQKISRNDAVDLYGIDEIETLEKPLLL